MKKLRDNFWNIVILAMVIGGMPLVSHAFSDVLNAADAVWTTANPESSKYVEI